MLEKEKTNFLIENIMKYIQITDNQKVRKAFIRNCFRIYKKRIKSDGRNGSIMIEITKRFNRNCKHCYANGNQNKVMDQKTLDLIISYVKDNYKYVFFTGGEPLLDLRTLETAEKNPDIMFFMFTNGGTLNQEYANKIASLGNLIPIVSVDGSCEEIHDLLKGNGSFNEAMQAIDNLNRVGASWGYLSVVTNSNSKDVLSKEFIKMMKNKGAILARYLEFLPVGSRAFKNSILTGETYHLMEKRKKEIIKNKEIYIQDLSQGKCGGLLFMDVDGNIKNCPFFHFSKHNIREGKIKEKISDSIKDWGCAKFCGECPIYSDPVKFKDYLVSKGWKHLLEQDEEYLTNPKITNYMKNNYKKFLDKKQEDNL